MTDFCVFTPTYNRAHTLPRLYESLKRQQYKNFVWDITDDGSTDSTEQLVESFLREGILRIRYSKCENGGKTRAVNCAAQRALEELFICVDSDDWLSDDALAEFNKVWQHVRQDNSIAGMIALHGLSDGTCVGTGMPHNVRRTNAWDLYYKYHFKGDAIHVYRTEVFKKFPAPVANGEKFMSEGWAIHHIAQTYEVVLIDRILHYGDYLEDGLSRNVRKLTCDNPIGYYKSKAFFYSMSKTLYLKLYNITLYDVGCLLARNDRCIMDAPSKLLACFGLLPAFVLTKTVFRRHHYSRHSPNANN